MNPIHEKALAAAHRFHRAEADLISALQEVEENLTFLEFKCSSLFQYGLRVLRLSENVTSNFIAVMRAARRVPELKAAIQSEKLSVSKARKITPVVSQDPEKWIDLAMNFSSKKVEEEVAKVCPKEAVKERIKPVSEDLRELRLGISKALEGKLRRAQDLESQRRGKAASLEETLDTLLDVYLEVKDLVRRAERVLQKVKTHEKAQSPVMLKWNETNQSGKSDLTSENGDYKRFYAKDLDERSQGRRIPSALKHQVFQRDQGKCTHPGCDERRWLDIHHLKPVSEGGLTTLENLATLCQAHHRITHGMTHGLTHRSGNGILPNQRLEDWERALFGDVPEAA